MCRAVLLVGLALLPGESRPEPSPAAALRFELRLDGDLQPGPFQGRVYVLLSERPGREPRLRVQDWFRPPRIIARDVDLSGPDPVATLDQEADAFPEPIASLPAGAYQVQAVARRSRDCPVPGQGAGDLYSSVQTLTLDPQSSGTIRLRLDQVVRDEPPVDHGRVRFGELSSPLLSAFHGRPMKMRYAVILPDGWAAHLQRRYPALYWIGSFGSTHRFADRLARILDSAAPEAGNVLVVVPDPSCYRGHHVFVDSANNGPWGRALIDELIPDIEHRFRGPQDGGQRYVTGVSSGGWSSLWLQITYPQSFHGCWAHVPDPVDFRDFQRIDLYAPGVNMFHDARDLARPLARRGEQVLLHYREFVDMETALGPGGQIHSFEAAFSPRGLDGQPQALFDRNSGAVDPRVATAWKPFDIRLILEQRWPTLGPQLAGKLHIFAGEDDQFLLDGAVRNLQTTLARLGSDAEVMVVPGMSHTLYRAAIRPMFATILRPPTATVK